MNDDISWYAGLAPSEKPRTAAAARMERHRKRYRKGLRCYTVELRATEIDELVRRRLLRADEKGDHVAVLRGFYRFLDRALSDKSYG